MDGKVDIVPGSVPTWSPILRPVAFVGAVRTSCLESSQQVSVYVDVVRTAVETSFWRNIPVALGESPEPSTKFDAPRRKRAIMLVRVGLPSIQAVQGEYRSIGLYRVVSKDVPLRTLQ